MKKGVEGWEVCRVCPRGGGCYLAVAYHAGQKAKAWGVSPPSSPPPNHGQERPTLELICRIPSTLRTHESIS